MQHVHVGKCIDYSSQSPTLPLYPVKSLVLRWRPVLSRFNPRVQRSHEKKIRLTEGCEPRTSDISCLCQRMGSGNTLRFT